MIRTRGRMLDAPSEVQMAVTLRELPIRVARADGGPLNAADCPQVRLFAEDAGEDQRQQRFVFEDRVTVEAGVPQRVRQASVCFDCSSIVFDGDAETPCPRCNRPIEPQPLAMTRRTIMGKTAETYAWDHVSVWARLIVGLALVGLIPARMWWPRAMFLLVAAGGLALLVTFVAAVAKRGPAAFRRRCELMYYLVSASCPRCGEYRDPAMESPDSFRNSRRWGRQMICPACRFPMSGGILCPCGELYDEEQAGGSCPRCGTLAVMDVYPRGNVLV